jgi:hypothetical protein
MKRITIEVMDLWEAVQPFITDEELIAEYTKESKLYRDMKLDDELSIMDFLDYDAIDIRRLNEKECELLGLEHAYGWYINTWNTQYRTEA